jgi:ASC-1-like (ASCH) protein
MTHALKTWPEYYKAVESGKKNFEVRRMDRPFKVGDKLILQEYNPIKGEYTGSELERRITYILPGKSEFGMYSDFCVMGLEEIEKY